MADFKIDEKIYHAQAGSPPLNLIQKIRAWAANPFPPSKIDQRLFSFDFWEGSGAWNPEVTKAYSSPKVSFVIIRSGQGLYESYDDKKFIENARKAILNKIPWIAYHVLIPQQDPIGQAEHLYSLVNQLGSELPSMFAWDVELVNEQTPKTISTKTMIAMRETRELFKKPTSWYSAPWFTDKNMEMQDWMFGIENPYWHAQWLWPEQQSEHPGTNLTLPYGNVLPISQLIIHQTTSYGNGALFGLTGRLDYDRWCWSEDKFREIFGIVSPIPPITPEPSDHEERITKLEGDIDSLMRWAKGIAYD